jgi:hypothetical protein
MDDTLWLSVLVGTLTGVAANLATAFVTNVVLPTYRSYVYKGVEVCGDWVIATTGDVLDREGLAEHWDLLASLEQKANEITGRATARRNRADGSEVVIGYSISGHIYDRILSLTFRTRDQALIAYSTFLVEVVGDGTEMRGLRTFYGLRRGGIRGIECVWRKGGSVRAQ